ncbi:hypothetical protein ACFZC6_16560 [Streptomyces ossamyceticus]|uniref:hypothetical protein n=1 Tax=Streptomyces ossamyceticus TaxID=249581 RepID=UPI0036E4FB7F
MTLTRNGDLMSVIPPDLDGAAIPGGCDTCNAEQNLVQVRPGVWSIGIAHDDSCPTWRRIQAQRATTPDTFRP